MTPGADERAFWNQWNADHREETRGFVSLRQADIVTAWLAGETGRRILEVGCGTGWMSERLLSFGDVIGIDLADEVVDRAQVRAPDATFITGDFMTAEVGSDFDVIVCLEVLSHVPDQQAFLDRIHDLLAPGGRLLLATQNRPVLQRWNRIPPPSRGLLRRWVDRDELADLTTAAGFRVDQMYVVSPLSDHGVMRVVAKAGRVLHANRLLEKLGFGWTIMMAASPVRGS